MEMPNTNPQTVTLEALDRKMESAAGKSTANFSFYLGATNNNLAELKKADSKKVCGVKVFMGASTGNMLVDNERALQGIFAEVDALIATHCEKEEIIRENIDVYRKKFGEEIPISAHPLIRSTKPVTARRHRQLNWPTNMGRDCTYCIFPLPGRWRSLVLPPWRRKRLPLRCACTISGFLIRIMTGWALASNGTRPSRPRQTGRRCVRRLHRENWMWWPRTMHPIC